MPVNLAKSQNSPADYLSQLASNLQSVRQRIEVACKVCHRNPDDIRLVAISKGQPAEKIHGALELGLRDFGENYAQELKLKRSLLPASSDARFSYVGRIQSNKLPIIAAAADEVQSLTTYEQATLLLKQLAKAPRPSRPDPFPVWILINSGDESTKDGVPLSACLAFAQTVAGDFPGLRLRGLMAIPPPIQNSATITEPPPIYLALRDQASELKKILPSSCDGLLSLGMSDDLEWAIRAGSNCLRIGTALFGPRLPKPT